MVEHSYTRTATISGHPAGHLRRQNFYGLPAEVSSPPPADDSDIKRTLTAALATGGVAGQADACDDDGDDPSRGGVGAERGRVAVRRGRTGGAGDAPVYP
jgi:hypothetical protein